MHSSATSICSNHGAVTGENIRRVCVCEEEGDAPLPARSLIFTVFGLSGGKPSNFQKSISNIVMTFFLFKYLLFTIFFKSKL